jgi:hypothetical protein
MPVLRRADLVGAHAERGQLRFLPQAALELGEPGEAGQWAGVVNLLGVESGGTPWRALRPYA